MMRLERRIFSRAFVLLAGCVLVVPLFAQKDEEKRLANSADVLQQIVSQENGLPKAVLDKAYCVLIFPGVKKVAIGIGGSYGRGELVCRKGAKMDDSWGAPAMYALEGASVGFQIGGEATDFVFLLMNDRAASSLLHSKVKLGADASAAAGPKGRSAEADSDAYMRAEILSYSRARGVFAGISLEGSTLRPDEDANRKLYGSDARAANIVRESDSSAPRSAHDLLASLQTASPQLKR